MQRNYLDKFKKLFITCTFIPLASVTASVAIHKSFCTYVSMPALCLPVLIKQLFLTMYLHAPTYQELKV